MKLLTIILMLFATTEARYITCTSTLPFVEICAYAGCFLNINQQDLQTSNCDRRSRGLMPLTFVNDGKCAGHLMPMCQTFEF